MAITTADPYGLDYSLLSGPNQNTARQIQTAFTNSMNARNRAMQRYGIDSQLKYSPAMGASLLEDTALAQASSAADAINKNQQLQTMIDASKATPHGVAANLSAFAPYLGLAPYLSSMLFGSGATNDFFRQGAIPTAWNALKNVFTDPNTGLNYATDATGKIIGTYDQAGNVIPSYGYSAPMDTSQLTSGGAASGGWTSGFGGDTGSGMYGWDTSATTAPYDFSGSFTPPATDWTSGFDIPALG